MTKKVILLFANAMVYSGENNGTRSDECCIPTDLIYSKPQETKSLKILAPIHSFPRCIRRYRNAGNGIFCLYGSEIDCTMKERKQERRRRRRRRRWQLYLPRFEARLQMRNKGRVIAYRVTCSVHLVNFLSLLTH
jgi:hypothetical protein